MTISSDYPARRFTSAILTALVLAVTFLAFLPVLSAGFNWDDDVNLLDNPYYRGLGWRQLRWMFTTMLLGHYIPLTWLSFGVNYLLGGMSPWGYHLGNLLLHTANAGLFYFVARRLLAAAFQSQSGPGRSLIERDVAVAVGAAFAALVFGVHPLRVESVAWVTERRDVLCGFFYLLAVLAYLRGVAGGAIRPRWWAASLGSFALALLSKAAGMPLPAALVVVDVYPLRRHLTVGWRQLLVEKIPYLLLGGGAALLAAAAQSAAGALTGYAQYGIGARVAITAYSLVFYLWKLIWAADLSPLYELPQKVSPLTGQFLFAELACAALTAALMAGRRRWPGGLGAWVYSALLVLPVTGAIAHAGVQLVADRYSYLSGLGFAVLAGGGLTWVLRQSNRLKSSVVAACFMVTVLAVTGWSASSWRQSRLWRDPETLWRQAEELNPDCAICKMNLGAQLVAPPSNAVRAHEAEGLFRQALVLRPDRVYAYHGLGVSLTLQHRDDEAEAAFREYLQREPASATGLTDLGLLRLSQHRYPEAIPFLRRALAMEPNPRLRSDLARALREHAMELAREGKQTEADGLLSEARALSRPSSEPPHSQGSATTTLK